MLKHTSNILFSTSKRKDSQAKCRNNCRETQNISNLYYTFISQHLVYFNKPEKATDKYLPSTFYICSVQIIPSIVKTGFPNQGNHLYEFTSCIQYYSYSNLHQGITQLQKTDIKFLSIQQHRSKLTQCLDASFM